MSRDCCLRIAHRLWGVMLLLGGVAPLLAAPPAVTAIGSPAVQVGTTTTLALVGKPGTSPLLVWCDRPEIVCSITAEKPQLQVEVPADSAPGLCWVRIYNSEGSTAPLPLLIGMLPQVEEKEPNNHPREAQALETLPVAIQGVLHKSGEVDTYAVTLRAGEQLVASVAAFEAFNSPMDGVLQVLSEDGYVAEQNDDHHSNDPQIEFVAPHDGTWFVRVFAFPSTPNSSINFAGGSDYQYRLTLTTGPFVDHLIRQPDGSSRAAGWNLNGNETALPQPGLHLWRPPVSADLPTRAAESSVTIDTWATGTLNAPGEQASLNFKATKGTTYRIRVEAQSRGSVLDPVLTIADAAGATIKEADDISRTARDVDLTWKAPGDGEFQLKLTDRFGHGSMRHFYALLVEQDRPRVELTLAATQFVVKRADTLEIPVTVTRSGGFAEALTVTAIDLPEGVELTTAVSEPKGDSSKAVKLKIKAGTAAEFNGPIRIVAHSGDKGGSDPVTTATASLPLEGWTTSAIWLTIPAGKSDDSAKK